MLKHSQQQVSALVEGVLWSLLILIPLFVLPIFPDFMAISKQLLFVLATIVVLVLFGINSIRHGSLQVSFSSLSGSLLFFLVAILASTFVTTKYPVDNLMGMGGTYIASVLFALLASSLLSPKQTQKFPLFVALSGGLLSVATLLQTVGGAPARILNLLFGINLPTTAVFNLAGSPYLAAQWLGLSAAALLLWVLFTKKMPKYLWAALPVIVIGLGMSIWSILPGKDSSPLLLPHTASWSIALDTLRYPRTAIVGVGIDNYEAAFNQFKPTWLNNTNVWNVSFSQGSNTPFTLLTNAGILGLGAWLMLMWVLYRLLRSSKQDASTKALIAAGLFGFALQFFVAPNVILVIWQSVILTLIAVATKQRELFINPFAVTITDEAHPWVTPTRQLPGSQYIIAAICLVLVAVIGFGAYRGYAAAYYSFASLMAADKGEVVKVYETQQKAIQLNPFVDSYRQQYAMINIQIAAALSNKTDITEAEKKQVADLIQQAIREAQAATTLSPERTANWQVLARIYSQLQGVAADADQWTVSAYAQAIQLAPSDALLRMELGGVFLGQQNYQQALSLFQQTVQLKPDYANGYYNAGVALRELKAYPEAKAAYEQALALANNKESESYIQAQKELQGVLTELEKAAEATKSGAMRQAAAPVTPVEASESAQTPLSILDQTVNSAGQNQVQPQEQVTVPGQDL